MSVMVNLQNRLDSDVLVPACGDSDVENHRTPLPPAFFEQYDGSAWKPVASHSTISSTDCDLTSIAAHQSESIQVRFTRENYDWKPGELVRLVVSGWPASIKVRTAQNAIRYTTAPLHLQASAD
jgi:hypothetical protein